MILAVFGAIGTAELKWFSDKYFVLPLLFSWFRNKFVGKMAKDIYHDAVREALEKDGWIITHDSFPFKVGEVGFFIDLGAEKLLVAEKGYEKIAVEVKSFIKSSPFKCFS